VLRRGRSRAGVGEPAEASRLRCPSAMFTGWRHWARTRRPPARSSGGQLVALQQQHPHTRLGQWNGPLVPTTRRPNHHHSAFRRQSGAVAGKLRGTVSSRRR